MSSNINHIGTVAAVGSNVVDVLIHAKEACASCYAKGSCGAAEGESKVISVYTEQAQFYNVGESVEVSISQTMGIKAVIIAYVFPFLLTLGLLLGLLKSGVSELVAGISALVLMTVYFIGVYVFRNKIEKEIIFKITKI